MVGLLGMHRLFLPFLMHRVTNYRIPVVSTFSTYSKQLYFYKHTLHIRGTKQCLEHHNMPSYVCCRCWWCSVWVFLLVGHSVHTYKHAAAMNDFIQELHVQGYQCTHDIAIQLAVAEEGGAGGGEGAWWWWDGAGGHLLQATRYWMAGLPSVSRDCWAVDWLGLGHSTPSPASGSGYWRTNSDHQPPDVSWQLLATTIK